VTPIKTLLAGVLAVSIAGCSSTETGNPEATGQLHLALISGDPSVASLGGMSPIVVEHAWLSFGDLTLTGCDAPHLSERVPAPPLLDLARANPGLELKTQLSQICAVNTALNPALVVPVGAPSSLNASTLVLQGRRADGIAFELQSTEPLNVSLTSVAGFDPKKHSIILSFDVSTWFQGLDLANAALTSGQVSISYADNLGLLRAFEANMPRGAKITLDENNNGLVDPGESVLATPH